MGCTEYRVRPTALQTIINVIIPCTHINTSLLQANEANLCECGELKIVPLEHR
jgi:hypothetical protein